MWIQRVKLLSNTLLTLAGVRLNAGFGSSLWQFLTDNAPDTAVTWWDVTIEFRDTDKSVQKDIARFCFDVESGQLFVRAVPYTERGFVPLSSELSE